MEIYSGTKLEKLFSKAYKYRSYIKNLEEFEIEEVLSVTENKIAQERNTICEMINMAGDSYNYPENVDKSKLFEYWAERNGNDIYKLKNFRKELREELKKRSSQIPDDARIFEKFKFIDEAIEISNSDLIEFIERQTNKDLYKLKSLLADLNLFASEQVPAEAPEMTEKKRAIIDERLDKAGIDSFEEGWDVYLDVLNPFDHVNLIKLKKHILEMINIIESKKASSKEAEEKNYSDPYDVAVKFRSRAKNSKYSTEIIGKAMGITRDFILENELETLDRKKSEIERHIRENIPELRERGTSVNTVKNWIDFYYKRMNPRATKT